MKQTSKAHVKEVDSKSSCSVVSKAKATSPTATVPTFAAEGHGFHAKRLISGYPPLKAFPLARHDSQFYHSMSAKHEINHVLLLLELELSIMSLKIK